MGVECDSKNFCPVSSAIEGVPFVDDKIPAQCRQLCEERWGQAVRSNPVDGYDYYDDEAHRASCERALTSGLENSHDGLVKGEGGEREYVLVDKCEACGIEVGEQAYAFQCPYNKP